jgi:hypothetical protein
MSPISLSLMRIFPFSVTTHLVQPCQTHERR